jgi:cysteine desulfurase
MAERHAHVCRLRELFLRKLMEEAAPIHINGDPLHSLPHIVNVSFPGCQAEVLLMRLDLLGVACSTGSACSSGSLQPSPVLRAMGCPEALLHSAMRFSFSHMTTAEEIDLACERIIAAVKDLRQMQLHDQ